MPSGERLEAHSGYGDGFDNMEKVSTRMVGPTPPNTYLLSMREKLFHGVQALRMRPVGDGKMYGRDGFLTHSYLMGERGDSNGCVSFKDYDKFLEAYKRGEVTRNHRRRGLANPPPPAPDANPLLAWLAGKGPLSGPIQVPFIDAARLDDARATRLRFTSTTMAA